MLLTTSPYFYKYLGQKHLNCLMMKNVSFEMLPKLTYLFMTWITYYTKNIIGNCRPDSKFRKHKMH